MRRIPPDLLRRMAQSLAADDRDEMAIPSYLHPNPVLRWMAWRRVEVIAKSLQRRCAARDGREQPMVMDFGCGTGVLFDEASLHARRIFGVDPVLNAARILLEEWKLEKVELLTPEQAEVKIPEHSIDIILAAEVLEHLDPLDKTLDFFRRCLKPDGRLLVTVPTGGVLYRLGRRLAGFHGHYHHSNAASIHAQVVKQGFRQESMKKVPAPGPFAIYWVIDYSLPVVSP